MDIEKLIDRLDRLTQTYAAYSDLSLAHALYDAATALSTLQGENENLRSELDRVKGERDAAISDLTYIARTYPIDLCDDLVCELCQYCKHYQNFTTGCPGWTENDCFEWRGKKEE